MLADAKNYITDALHLLLSFACCVQFIPCPSLHYNHVELWANMSNFMVKYYKNQSFQIKCEVERSNSFITGSTGEDRLCGRRWWRCSTFRWQNHNKAAAFEACCLLFGSNWPCLTSAYTCERQIFKLSRSDVMQQPNHCKYGASCHQWNKIGFYTRQELSPHPVMLSERKGL